MESEGNMREDYFAEARDLAIQSIPNAIKALTQIMEDESASPTTRVRAASALRKFIAESEKHTCKAKHEETTL